MIRWLTGIAGAGLAAFGVFRLLTEVDTPNLRVLAVWLAVAVLLHDGVLAPVTAVLGSMTTRLPARLRRYLQGGLVVIALVAVIALPLVYREGRAAPEKALLRQHYATNLAVLAGLIAGGTAVLYLVRAVRDQRARVTKVRPPDTHISSSE